MNNTFTEICQEKNMQQIIKNFLARTALYQKKTTASNKKIAYRISCMRFLCSMMIDAIIKSCRVPDGYLPAGHRHPRYLQRDESSREPHLPRATAHQKADDAYD